MFAFVWYLCVRSTRKKPNYKTWWSHDTCNCLGIVVSKRADRTNQASKTTKALDVVEEQKTDTFMMKFRYVFGWLIKKLNIGTRVLSQNKI